ncbi:MAG: alpha/beta hydrolase [Cyclobacteriaceae bacterium]
MGKKKDKTPPALKVIRWVYPKLENVFPFLAYRLFVYIFFSPLRYKPTPKEIKAESFSKKFTLSAAGKKIQCYRWGDFSKYVLVVHGWAGRATQFRRFVKPLNAAGYSVLGFDGPAHGKSEGRSTDILEYEVVLNTLFKQQGIPDAIIAHSFGGAAVIFAAAHGLPVKKLVNMASPSIGDEIIDTYLRAINGSEKTKQFFKKYVLQKTGKPFDAFTASYKIKEVKQPMELLLVHDEDDKDVSINHPLVIQKAYPRAQLLRTMGLGHTRLLKDNEVIRQIVTFVSGVPS